MAPLQLHVPVQVGNSGSHVRVLAMHSMSLVRYPSSYLNPSLQATLTTDPKVWLT